jgi:hypothetical protein
MVAVHLTLADEPLQKPDEEGGNILSIRPRHCYEDDPNHATCFCAVLGKSKKGKPGGPYADVHQVTDGQFTVNESDN